MSYRDNRNNDRSAEGKVYVGNLSDNTQNEELDDIFRRYGKIRNIWIARRPGGFGFVEFEDALDAEDAVKALDGTKVAGSRIKVELSRRKNNNRNSRGGGGRGGGGRDGGRNYGRNYDRQRSRSPRRRASVSPRRRASPSPKRSPQKDAYRSPRKNHSRSRSVTPQ
uniref:RRM domain-containing protein n=1 Tax=Panagrolaimus davidi TaxID=227884 RepID=A0A914P5B8_9BILA